MVCLSNVFDIRMFEKAQKINQNKNRSFLEVKDKPIKSCLLTQIVSSRLTPLKMEICFKIALKQKRRMIRRHRIRRQRRKKSLFFGEIISEILSKTYSKSITSIRNISLKPNRSSILNSLMMLLKYPLSRLLLIQLLVLPRWGFLASESINSFNNIRVARSTILNCRINGLLKNSNI